MSEASNAGSLAGLNVIEMGSFIAGPFCGQLLADQGADVIKIEPPGSGDAMRQWGTVQHEGKSLWWPVIARNKRSLTLDLRKPEGVEIAAQLLSQADILVENFRPGTLERWGLAPAQLLERNRGLIVARVSGFGQTGPYAERVGFGAVAEAMAGMRALGGFPDRPPPRAGLSLGDSLAGMFTTIGVLSALNARRTTGRGQIVDVGITDAVLGVLESVLSEYSATGLIRERAGTVLPGIAPSNLYPTADHQWILIAGNGDAIFRRLAQVMDRPELASDARFSTHRARGDRQQELDGIVAAWTRTCTLADLLSILEESGVPAGPVSDAAEISRNPHFLERGALVQVPSEEYGALTMQGVVPRLSDSPGEIRWVGPALGEHTDQILGEELGYDSDAIDDLRRRGIV
ncbi:CoA transferase [uncultured Paracoccus sp.]|uniref:CaiB/BaiF CoA transferase family protein n=1 Tax=uncultured Paracoccus sp. TaxID=189685 RepID=UPI002614F2BC|nr:CoA transferase [uncultured Paracoccus sp.]